MHRKKKKSKTVCAALVGNTEIAYRDRPAPLAAAASRDRRSFAYLRAREDRTTTPPRRLLLCGWRAYAITRVITTITVPLRRPYSTPEKTNAPLLPLSLTHCHSLSLSLPRVRGNASRRRYRAGPRRSRSVRPCCFRDRPAARPAGDRTARDATTFLTRSCLRFRKIVHEQRC